MLQPAPQPDLLVRRLVILEVCHHQPQEGEHHQLRHGLGQTNSGWTDAATTRPTCEPACLQPYTMGNWPPASARSRPSGQPWGLGTQKVALGLAQHLPEAGNCGLPETLKGGNHEQLLRPGKERRTSRSELKESQALKSAHFGPTRS